MIEIATTDNARIAAEFIGALVLFFLRSPIDRFKQWTKQKGISQMNSDQVMRILASLSTAIQGVEVLHTNSDSLTKQDMAIGSAVLASGVYSIADPSHAQQAQAVGQALIPVTQGIVSLYNLIGSFTHKKQPAAPAPAPLPNPGLIPPVLAVGPEPAPGNPVAVSVATLQPTPGPGLHTQFNG